MQYVNDDMDELFKRAAENYPLDTKTADWNKVLAALQNETETKPEKKGNKNGRFLWLLLLLPLGLICNRFYSPGNLSKEEISKTSAEEKSSSNNLTTQEEDITFNKTNSATTDELNTTNTNTTNTIVGPAGNNKKDLSTKNSSLGIPGISVQTPKNSSFVITNRPGAKAARYSSTYNSASSSNRARNESVSNPGFVTEEPSSFRNYISSIVLSKRTMDAFSTSVNRSMNPLFQQKNEIKQNIQVARRKKLYAGFMGGIDATTVKFQKIENTGFSYGLLLGYQFNKKWSIETGAYLERKYYYSDGKYVNTSKLYLPANTWIDDASGNCKMIEVPLVVKYDISTHKNSNWFATFGTSSYIMQKENYTYNYYYGTIGPVPHKKEYSNSSTNLFSALSISGGYTHRLGNFGDIRVEPYVKLPLSGMGTVKLPFSSTGLQIGVIKKF